MNARTACLMAEERFTEQQEINERHAQEMLREGKTVNELIYGYEIDLSDELARVMREIDGACVHNVIAMDAVFTACSHMQDKLLRAARHSAGVQS